MRLIPDANNGRISKGRVTPFLMAVGGGGVAPVAPSVVSRPVIGSDSLIPGGTVLTTTPGVYSGTLPITRTCRWQKSPVADFSTGVYALIPGTAVDWDSVVIPEGTEGFYIRKQEMVSNVAGNTSYGNGSSNIIGPV